MTIEIEQKLMEKVIQYLVNRPYAEVAPLIQEIGKAVNESILKKPPVENVVQMPVKGKK